MEWEQSLQQPDIAQQQSASHWRHWCNSILWTSTDNGHDKPTQGIPHPLSYSLRHLRTSTLSHTRWKP